MIWEKLLLEEGRRYNTMVDTQEGMEVLEDLEDLEDPEDPEDLEDLVDLVMAGGTGWMENLNMGTPRMSGSLNVKLPSLLLEQ